MKFFFKSRFNFLDVIIFISTSQLLSLLVPLSLIDIFITFILPTAGFLLSTIGRILTEEKE